MAKYTLISNGTTTSAPITWPGGRGSFSVSGTLGGATVQLQCRAPDGTSWLDAGTALAMTAEGIANFELPNLDIRAEVTGGTPSALYATVEGIPTSKR